MGLAVRSVGAAMATASAWLALVIWTTIRLRGDQGPTRIEDVDPGAAYVNVLLWGVVATLPITGAVLAARISLAVSTRWTTR